MLGSEVMVEFVGSLSKAGLDVVKSKVMWVSPILNHREKICLIGLEFANDISKTKTKKIGDYVNGLKNDAA